MCALVFDDGVHLDGGTGRALFRSDRVQQPTSCAADVALVLGVTVVQVVVAARIKVVCGEDREQLLAKLKVKYDFRVLI